MQLGCWDQSVLYLRRIRMICLREFGPCREGKPGQVTTVAEKTGSTRRDLSRSVFRRRVSFIALVRGRPGRVTWNSAMKMEPVLVV